MVSKYDNSAEQIPCPITDLPSCSLSEYSNLPGYAGIYFVISDSSELLYIGKSINIRQRVSEYYRSSSFSNEGKVRIAWLIVNELDLNEKEKALIRYHRPRYNRLPKPVVIKKVTFQLQESVFEQLKDAHYDLGKKLGKDAPYREVIIEEAIVRLLDSLSGDDRTEVLDSLRTRQLNRK